MRPSKHQGSSIAAPLPTIQETTGKGAVIITITMIVLVLTRRRRSTREGEVGVVVGVGAGASLVAVVATAGHPPTAAKERVGEKGEGSESE